MTIVCVFKVGRDFTISGENSGADYVLRLKRAVERNTTRRFRFICLTDSRVPGVECIPLQYNWPTWWSKIELFRLRGDAYLYFDLDTVICGSIDSLIDYVEHELSNQVLMLEGQAIQRKTGDAPFKGYNRPHSGIMAWSSDLSQLVDRFNGIYADSRHEWRTVSRFTYQRLIHGLATYEGDQDWIVKELNKMAVVIKPIQDVFPHILSYKRHIVEQKVPIESGSIVCFHGTPRPHEVQPPPQWMKTHWYSNEYNDERVVESPQYYTTSTHHVKLDGSLRGELG